MSVAPEGVSSGHTDRSDTTTSSKRIYCLHFPSYNSARLSLKVSPKL